MPRPEQARGRRRAGGCKERRALLRHTGTQNPGPGGPHRRLPHCCLHQGLLPGSRFTAPLQAVGASGPGPDSMRVRTPWAPGFMGDGPPPPEERGPGRVRLPRPSCHYMCRAPWGPWGRRSTASHQEVTDRWMGGRMDAHTHARTRHICPTGGKNKRAAGAGALSRAARVAAP